jgi:hypothetical protein
MKKLIVLSTVCISLLLPSNASARWTNIIRDHSGTTFYLDVLRIVKNERYVYFWELIDYLKPTETGVLSHEVFAQGDCKLNRKKTVSFSSHKKPMGAGLGLPYEPKNSKWMEPSPGSAMETVVKSACELAR